MRPEKKGPWYRWILGSGFHLWTSPTLQYMTFKQFYPLLYVLNNMVLNPVLGSFVNMFLSHPPDILLSSAVPLQFTWH